MLNPSLQLTSNASRLISSITMLPNMELHLQHFKGQYSSPWPRDKMRVIAIENTKYMHTLYDPEWACTMSCNFRLYRTENHVIAYCILSALHYSVDPINFWPTVKWVVPGEKSAPLNSFGQLSLNFCKNGGSTVYWKNTAVVKSVDTCS